MKNRNWKTYAFWIGLAEGVGALSGWLTREGTKAFNAAVRQPPLSPPPILFPIVWGILYALMGIGAARVYLTGPSRERSQALNLFVIQLAVNFLWSLIFFNFQAFGFAFVWLLLLWLLIAAMIHAFRRADEAAGNLQIPYWIWVTFAAYLNFGVWVLN